MDVFNIFSSIVSGIISGLIASFFFIKYLSKRKRPNVKISKFISKQTIADQKDVFLFKFVNYTDSDIFDVHIELVMFKPIGGVDGTNYRVTDIKLKDNFISFIEKENSENTHAFQIYTKEDLNSLWTDESTFLRLSIVSKHSLSGMNSISKMEFHSKDLISSNKFKIGNSLEIQKI